MNVRYVAVVLIVSILVVAASVSFLALTKPRESTSQTSSNTSEEVTKTTLNQTSGLSLELILSVSSLTQRQAILIQVQEYNSLGKLNTVSSSDTWGSANLGIGFGPCAFVNEPLRTSVFEGYYASSNFSTATPLQVVNPLLIYSCPPVENIHYYAFLPMSTIANVSACLGVPCVNRYFSTSIDLSESVNGTWSDSTKHLEPLNQTTYTVVAGDEWGDVVLSWFNVTS